jgi:hypothetical protein
MSRKLKLALHQASALQSIPVDQPFAETLEDPKPLDTRIHRHLPPMSIQEALLTGSRWVDIAVPIRAAEERRRFEESAEEETCGGTFAE